MKDFTFNSQTVEDLISHVKNSGIGKLRIKTEYFEIEIENAPPQQVVALPTTASVAAPQQVELNEATASEAPETGNIVKSPIVGTFYSTPSPDKPPFVKVGQTVNEGDVLFIIESMKLMNEVKSEYSGKITKILVESGQSVEYNQPILVIE